MNCLEYRHALLAEPARQSNDMLTHMHLCENCAQFAYEQVSLEERLYKALAVDVPEGLASRVLLRHSVEQRSPSVPMMRRYLAVAASILVAGLLAIFLQFSPTAMHDKPLEQVALRHVYDELKHLGDRKNVSLNDLNKVMTVASLRFSERPATIHYAGRCGIRKYDGAHIVVDGDQGPVTVLFMPGEHVPTRLHKEDVRFTVIVTPIQGGSMAIIGEKTEALERFEARLRSNIVYL